MKIFICVKRVPDTAVQVKITSDGKKVDRTDAEYVIGPYDEIAVEHAMRIKDKNPSTEVVILTLGPAEAEKQMRSCLAMGADRGILLEHATDTLEAYPIAKVLAEQISIEKPDLILCGIKATDSDNAQIGAMIAAILNIPYINTVVKFQIEDAHVKAESELEVGHLTMEAAFPCVLSIQKSNVDPRICSLLNMRKAKTKEIKKIPVSIPSTQWTIEEIALPPSRKPGKIIGEGAVAVPTLFQLLHSEAKLL